MAKEMKRMEEDEKTTAVNNQTGTHFEDRVLDKSDMTRIVIDSFIHPLFVINVADHKILLANLSAPSNWEGATCYAISHRNSRPCDSKEHPCPLEEVKKTKKPVILEHIHYDKEGIRKNVEVHCYPIFDHTGNVDKVIEYAVDITQRKQVENELKELESRYRTLFERSPDSILIIDPITMMPLMFNDRACDDLGYSREEFYSIPVSDYEFFETPDETKKHIEKMLHEGRGDFETKHRTKTGELKNVLVSVQTIMFSGRKVFNTIFHDITRSKKAEEALHESEERYRNLVNLASFGIMIHVDDKIVYSNPAAMKILGVTKPDDIIGKPIFEFIAPEYHALVRQRITKEEEGETVPLIEEKFVKLDGTVIDVEVIATPFKYNGKLGKYGIFQDITDRKMAHEEINRSLKEKEILLREIHHRVKNNLQIISSMLNLQSGYLDDEKDRDIFKECQTRISSMAFIHENLYMSGDFTRIDFNNYIKNLINSLFQSYNINENKIKLNINVDNISLGIGSAIPCGLIINELVTNSLKYAFLQGHEGQINIALNLKDENLFELIVSDNGIGLPHGFDFRTTDSMGLFLVRMLAEDQLDGELSLDQRKGTEFRIKFKGVN